MSTASSAVPLRPRPLLLALVAALGIMAGWFLGPSHSLTLAHAKALFEPAWLATMCISLLYGPAKQSRWLVPPTVSSALLTVASSPPVPVATAVSVSAGAVAVLASLLGHRRTAIAATFMCCAAVTVPLLARLLGQHVPGLTTLR